MRIALWNIRSGGAGRLPELATSLAAHDADLVVLNEYRTGASDPLIDDLRQRGWRHVALGTPPMGYGGVALCSRVPLKVRPAPAGLEDMTHRCLVVEVGGGADLVLYALYAPYEGPDVACFWRAVLEGAAADLERDTVLVGDFNAGVPGSDIPEDGVPGARYVRRLLEAGFQDLWRLQHGDAAREYTWQGPKRPYRLDHAYGSPGAAARARQCRYEHQEPHVALSDHSLLLLELTPRPLSKAGSRRWLQVAVNHHAAHLDPVVLASLGAPAGSTLEWLSPIEREGYIEYRDGATVARLGLELPEGALRDFWPNGGPVWDGLARVSTGDVLLVEAKAHIPEMLSAGTRATGGAREQILESIRALQRELAPRAGADWAGRFYQYVNRVAHLDFLRRHGVPAHLVYIYFLNATDVPGPKAREEWEGAIQLMESYLGISQHRLSRYIHRVFVDVRTLGEPVAGGATRGAPA